MEYSLIHPDPDSPYWYVLWSDSDGQHKASAKTTDKKVADERAQGVIQKWYKRQSNKSTTPDAPVQPTQKYVPQTQSPTHFSATMKLSQMVESYILIRPELEDSSKRKLRTAVSGFIKHVNKDPRLIEINDQMIASWKESFLEGVKERENMKKRPHTSWGLYVAYTDLRGMLEHLIEEDVLEKNPFKIKFKPAQPQRDAAGRAWSQQEIERLLEAAETHSKVREANTVANYARSIMPLLIKLGLLTGARTKELVELRWEHFTENMIHFVNTKTHQDRSFEINDDIREVRQQLINHYKTNWNGQEVEWVFQGKLDDHLSENVVQDHLKRIRISAGLKGVYGGKKFSLYETRHTTAVNLLQSGVEDTVVSNLLGHRDASMVRRVYGKYKTKTIPNVKMPDKK